MKQITIDRFDGIYAICEDKDKAFFAIETSELPQGAKAGDVLKITDDGALSIDVEETERRRSLQKAYNDAHGIVPKTIKKDVREVISLGGKSKKEAAAATKKLSRSDREKLIEEYTKEMRAASAKLEFEKAAYLRDRIKELRGL